ncbi:MAG: hypothetical protein QGF74_01930 [Candidatus Nanoarchaeia archaeon]|jgi:hypothetical protein|nr:hypothetical protein [Candidatus Nanoarchaeia archaeon]|tara:strand:- start:33033 stop:34445 length:1413 start_codon:yes stop_codon:yes gene_type:complete
MRKIVILLIVILLLTPNVYSQRLYVTDQSLIDKVYPGGTGVFELSVRNNQNVADTFFVTPDEFSVAPFSDIFENIDIEEGTLQIKANSVEKTLVRVRLREDIKPDKSYRTFVRIRSSSNPNHKTDHDLIVSVIPPEQLVEITSNILDEIVPGRKSSINIELKNKINVILEDVIILIESELFKEELKLKLFPYQETIKTIEFEIPPITSPGDYTLIITATQENKLRGSFVKDFKIIRNPNINEKSEKDSGFLTSTINLVKSNNGNLKVKEAFVVELNGFKRMFTTYNIDPDKIDNGNVEWNFELQPGESFNITAETDYRSIFIFIIVLLVFSIVVYYLYGKKVSVKKAVFKVKDDKGGISEIKVLLHIKNRLTNLKDVEIIDIAPNLVKPKHEFGTLKPAKMQRGGRGIRMLWTLKELLDGEERVISYEIESQLHIVGKLVLPRAKVRYKRKGKIVEVYSNKLTYFSTKER